MIKNTNKELLLGLFIHFLISLYIYLELPLMIKLYNMPYILSINLKIHSMINIVIEK